MVTEYQQYIPTPITPKVVNLDTQVAEYAIDDINSQNYPDTYASWGKSKIDWINSMQRPAAKYVLENYNCDHVEMVALSPSKSIKPNTVVFNVDCTNGKRFYASNLDLKEN